MRIITMDCQCLVCQEARAASREQRRPKVNSFECPNYRERMRLPRAAPRNNWKKEPSK